MKNKYLSLICFIFSGIIIYVWSTNGLKNYLAPSMFNYIKITSIVLIILGVFLLFIKSHERFKASDIILLLPILMLILSGDAKLNIGFAENRAKKYRTNSEIKTTQEISIEDTTTTTTQIIDKDVEIPTIIDFELKDSIYSSLANYITFPSDDAINSLNGKTVKVRGFALTSMAIIDKNYFALGKYEMSCCAADAEFVGFIVKNNEVKIENGAWYELIGVLKPGKDKDGYNIMYVEIIDINKINEEEQYVYPCYTYDDGTCKDLQKYGLLS